MTPAFIESMTRVVLNEAGLVVRVWREEAGVQDVYLVNNDIVEECRRHSNMGMAELAYQVASLPRVTAVEVVDADGNGVVLYATW